MILSIALGILLAIVTIAIHAVSSSYLIGVLRNHAASFQARFGELKALVLTAVWLLVTHILETGVWAIAYWYVVGGEKFPSFDDAAYFSTVTFSTLGYGDIVIEGHWRMLSACQAMTGLLVFGWSTALLFAVVERIWKRKLEEG
ncbi:MAG: potassium channel family protein [Planctomycetota bacterium]